ncbi:MAG: phosphotransferase [Candidatus Woesebacteria bacterium]|jgi:serine/threonine protein kinase
MLTNEHKHYPHLTFDTIDGVKVVVKDITPVETEFFSVFPNLDSVLYPIEIASSKAYYPFCPDGTITGKPKAIWEQAVRNIARLNNVFVPRNLEYIHSLGKQHYTTRFQETLNLAAQHNIKLPETGLDFVQTKISQLNFAECITHDDLIALNILVDNNTVKIIDWEHAKLNFRESDIGRLLGDLYFDAPEQNKHYYPTSWHDDLVIIYLKETKKLNPSYNLRTGAENILFAELWNHLGAIRATLKSGDIHSEWLRANAESFDGLCAKIKLL